MRQKLVRIQISHQELLNKMLIFSDILHSSFNDSIYQSEFPSILKLANITPVLKRVTEILRKTIEQSAYFQTSQKSLKNGCFANLQFYGFLSIKQQCGFRKGYSPQYCLLVMPEKWKNAVYEGKCFRALSTDLSKAFDCLSHELLMASTCRH